MIVYLLPLIIVATGIITLTCYSIIKEKPSSLAMWNIQGIFLLAALLLEILTASKIPIFFMRSGLVNDGITNTLGVCVLGAGLLLTCARFGEKSTASAHTYILTLCAIFFTLIGVHSNRIIFTIFATLGLMVSSKSALLTEAPNKNKADQAYQLIRRAFIFLMFSTFFTALCILTFGDTQFDQIQISLVRSKENSLPLQVIQLMVVFFGMFVGELPPVFGKFGSARKNTSWALSVIFLGFFVLLALQILLKLGVFIFTQVSVGAAELEPQIGSRILEYLRWAVSLGLVLLPVLAIMQKNIKQSFLLFMLNPALQILMAISFGQRELINYALAAIPQMVVAISTLIIASKALGLGFESDIKDWVGVGRNNFTQSVILLAALFSLAGFPPFYGALLIQKTLCVNSDFSYFVLFNLLISGYYAVRLSVLAYQKPFETIKTNSLLSFEKIFSLSLGLALFLMGIFWQPLYKYGAYSARHLFGDF